MTNILITGGAGFIGSNFVKILNNTLDNVNCIIVDKLTSASNYDNINEYIDNKKNFFYKVDITDYNSLNQIFTNHKIDTIINFAAESHVDNSIKEPLNFINSNIIGTFNLLKSSLDNWKNLYQKNLFFHISTDEVFGSLTLKETAKNELSRYNPQNPYSASKAASDMLIKSFSNTYKIKYIITHSCNNYGLSQNIEKFIPLIITNILKGFSLPIYGDGKNTREWIHVEDHCRAIIQLLLKGTKNNSYNISGKYEINNINLALLICNEVDNYLLKNSHLQNTYPNAHIYNNKNSLNSIKFVEDRKGHDFRYSLDCTKLENEIKFKPNINFEEGLKNTIKWYIENQKWWNK